MIHMNDVAKLIPRPDGAPFSGWGDGEWYTLAQHVLLNPHSSNQAMVEYLQHWLGGASAESLQIGIESARKSLADLHASLSAFKKSPRISGDKHG